MISQLVLLETLVALLTRLDSLAASVTDEIKI